MKSNNLLNRFIFIGFLLVFFMPFISYGAPPIPISTAITNEASSAGVDGTAMYIIQHVVVPLFEIAAAIGILYGAISCILSGIAEAKIEKSWAPLKEKVIIAFIAVVAGGLFIWLLDGLRTYQFN